ncbi:MAG: YdeI/OmpD-associated family protein [bacterium]|nr:YdeI/OmpD-associated family protein [bacterium]
MEPKFFRTPDEFRAWLELHHAAAGELLVGFHKKGSGKPSLTWPESVDEALCFGWIDSIRRRLDDSSYTIRFTPRQARSHWSDVNIARARALIGQGRMRPAGLAVFAARREEESGAYSYEQRSVDLAEPYAGLLKQDATAWAYFQGQPASYRKAVSWWIVSAKQEATRRRRLDKLKTCSAQGRRLPEFTLEKRGSPGR